MWFRVQQRDLNTHINLGIIIIFKTINIKTIIKKRTELETRRKDGPRTLTCSKVWEKRNLQRRMKIIGQKGRVSKSMASWTNWRKYAKKRGRLSILNVLISQVTWGQRCMIEFIIYNNRYSHFLSLPYKVTSN